MGGIFHNLRHPRRCYLVCATARSGSNLLTDGLHSTRLAGRPKQFFLEKTESAYSSKHGLDSQHDFRGFVTGIVSANATSNEVFGFKVMAWYWAPFLERLRTAFDHESRDLALLRNAFPRIQFIHVSRTNKLRQAISKAKALQSGLWKIQPGATAVAEPEFDPDLIRRCLAECEADDTIWHEFFQHNQIQPFQVTYEDLCADYDKTIRATLKFLGIRFPKNQQIEPITIRQADAISAEWEKRFLELNTGENLPDQPKDH